MKDKPKQPVIVCAALKHRDTEDIVVGARHYDQHMLAQLSLLKLTKRWTQGFIDQYNRFYDRQEAFDLAQERGQIKYRCGGDEGRLFSENLY